MNYKYATLLNELIIDNIFVRIFNKKNIKLADPSKFLRNLFLEISNRIYSIESNIPEKQINTNLSRLAKGKIFVIKKLIEALRAIDKVLVEHDLLHIGLEKNNFEIIIKLLQVI